MITSLRLVNFKNFADETLRVGPFTVIVGANASGKSNIRDAFRFLHGIGRGYTLAEIMGGKYGPGGQLEWQPIRGAPSEVARLERVYVYHWSSFAIQLELDIEAGKILYFIKVGFHPNSGFSILEEELRTESGVVYITKETGDRSSLSLLVGNKKEELTGVNRLKPALIQFLQHLAQSNAQLSDNERRSHELTTIRVISAIVGTLFLDLVPDRLREPAFPGATILGDFGQNMPTVLEAICADPARKDVLTSWLRELTPMDVMDLEFPRDPSGLVHLQFVERNGRRISTYSASDGTLRFLAMLAALLGPNPAGVYFFEEIDNGIHPNRLWLLLELIEKQTAKGNIQVVATTHSPDLLAQVNDTTFESTSVVSRLEDTEDAIIRHVDSLPNVKKLRKSQGLGRLHAGGWMETALAFTEGYNEEDDED